MKKKIALFTAVCILVTSLIGGGLTVFGANLKVEAPKTEYMENPIGLERTNPVFSWKLDRGDQRGIMQTSYQIKVAQSEKDLKDGTNLVWDSSVVNTNDCNGIPYAGEALQAGKQYFWNVTVNDNDGGTAVSETATFGMGMFGEKDWNNAQWISNTGGSGAAASEDLGVYSIECDFTVEMGSLGLMFGEPAANCFYMWQLNSDEDKTDHHLLFRPHKWVNGGPALLGEYDIESILPNNEFLNKEHTFKVEVNNGKIKAYLDDKLLTYDQPFGSTSARSEDYLEDTSIPERGEVGIRAFYGENDKDKLSLSRLVLKDANGKPVYYDDFSGMNSLTEGTVHDGQVWLAPEKDEHRIWPKNADANVYSVQVDTRILQNAAGLTFGAVDNSHFYMWQLNTFDHKGTTYLRPHIWNPGGALLSEVNINDVLPVEKAEGQMNTMRIDVDNGTLTCYVNGTKVDERKDDRLPEIGNVGFRMSADQASSTDEKAVFDNLLLRDSGGHVVSYDDFEDQLNRYGYGTIENGALTISKNGAQEIFLRDNTNLSSSKVPLLRKDFATQDKTITRATVYASALGHYELQLNGRKVGEDYMAPGWTEYGTRVQYQAYDVTAQLAGNAENTLGAMLAPGWYSGNISILGKNRYGNIQALIANLVIEYSDGTTQNVVTDNTWTYSMDGPIVETDMFDGETYDANKELGGSKYGWAKPSFDNSDWGRVGVMFDKAYSVKTGASGSKTIQLTAQTGPTVKKIKDVTPQSITTDVNGNYIVDMGQNFAGIVNLSLKGTAGETARIRYGEMLNDASGEKTGDGPEGTLYTANLRSAKATDYYTFQSDAKETWEPTFTFHGFRYVEISGVSEAPKLSDIKGIALASGMEETGTFDSSSALLNQIYSNTFWGQRSNFLSVPTDCPQRDERMGWGADTTVFAETGMHNMDAMMFYQKWLTDVRDGQASNGSYGDVAPNPHGFMNDVVWSSGGVVVPYTLWQMTGDTRVLSDGYSSMKKYMDFRASQGNLQSCGYGDWLEPVDGTSNKEVVGTTYYAYQLDLMAQIAGALGYSEDAQAYRAKYEAVKADFTAKHISADGTVSGDAQSAYVLTLGTGLASSENEALLVQKLVDRIEADGNLMSVGFVSVNMLMPVLTKYGHSDIAYQLAMNTEYPSWGYSIEQGATTIWERWNSYTKANGFGPVSMNSFNHYSFGSVCDWFYNGIAGINYDTENPGFEHIIISPAFDGRLDHAAASYDSIRGSIVSGWTRSADKVELNVTIPANTTATVVIPASLSTIQEGGLLTKKPVTGTIDGITKVDDTTDPGNVRIDVGSGSYSFSFTWKAPVIKTSLSSAITKAESKIQIEEDYTKASIDTVKEVIVRAKGVMDSPEATQDDVDAITEELVKATEDLVPGGNRNLAIGATVKASSSVSAEGVFAPGNLVDGKRAGDGGTTWSSSNSTNANHSEWVTLDLGVKTKFNRFLIFPRNDGAPSGYGFPKDFTIQVSEDGEKWTTVTARSDYPYAGTTPQRFTTPTEQLAQYVKLDMTSLNPNPADGNSYRAQLAEFEIYYIEGATVDKAELDALIKEAQKKLEEDYTSDTWSVFAEKLAAAIDVYEDPSATGAQIQAAYIELDQALKNLVKPDIAPVANWIWNEDTGITPPNTWMAFRKEVTLDTAPTGPVMAQIAADSKYWMYINDQMAVFEGSLKRGPNPQDTYVDNVDISQYLKAGENIISVLVYHYGKNGTYSHSNSGHGGLYFNAAGEGVDIISNQSWKVQKLDAFGTSAKPLNYRLPESNLKYDARLEIPGWYQTGFDDTSWAAASVYGKKGAAPWNDFADRPIPMFKYDDYTLFEDSDITKTNITTATTSLNIPVDEYVIEARFQVLSKAFGIVFGYQDSGNLNMWQINGDGKTKPILKPHLKTSGSWNTTGPQPEIEVAEDEIFTHDYIMKVEVKGKKAYTYIDGTLIDTRDVTYTSGGIGLRADSTERGSVDYLKVTSLDGQTVYYNDDFDSNSSFPNAAAENGRLIWQGVGNTDVTIASNVQDMVRYECKLPTNFQFTPYLEVTAPNAGSNINIYTDKTYVPDGPALQAEYLTKEGGQAYENLVWMNGDKLYFEVPSDVTVNALGYRKSGYDAEFDGSFTSDDEFLNTLWIKSRDTLYVTMRDNFMDCPDREKAQWWGDAVNEMQMGFYALSTDANLLAKKGIGNVLGYAAEDGRLPTVAPDGSGFQELPAQSLAGIMSYYMYYLYTGDMEVLQDAFGPSSKYLLLFEMKPDGTVKHRSGSWDWSDWGSGSDQDLITNEWYYIALDNTLKMAEALGEDMNSEQTKELLKRKQSIADNCEKGFWNSNGYYRSAGASVTDDRANALAVYAGLVPEEKYPYVRDVLNTVHQASPYMEKYVLEALYLMGYENDALSRMKTRYADMVASDYSTLWEFWEADQGTTNHAWTGGPLTMMSMYATGVSPLTPGYEKFKVAPQLGTIKTIDTKVPTVKGEIQVSIHAENPDELNLTVQVPEGTTGVIGVPLTGGKDATSVELDGNVIWENGTDTQGAALASCGLDDKFVYFESSSSITLTAKRGEVQNLTIDADDKENVQLYIDQVQKVMPYQGLYPKGKEVQIQFVSKYDGEYGISSIDGIELEDETLNDYTIAMDADYDLTAHVDYVGPRNMALHAAVSATDAMSAGSADWGTNNLTDGIRTSQTGKSGFTTKDYPGNDISASPQEITINLGKVETIHSVYLYPRTNAATADGKHPCYPKDFTISVSKDDVNYTVVRTLTGEIVPQGLRGEYTFDPVDAQYVKITTTKLGDSAADEAGVRYRVQLTEIEVFGETRDAQVIADSITELTAPEKDALIMPAPAVPAGFTAAITTSSNPAVIGLDGTIVPPEEDTNVTLIYTITKTSDNTSAQTRALTLQVPAATPVPPVITVHPQAAEGKEGSTASFAVTVTGTYPHYQWQYNDKTQWVDITDATDSTYTTSALTMLDNGMEFRCVITNKAGTAESNSAALTVTSALPTAQEIADGISVQNPTKDAVKLTMPAAAPGFEIALKSSDNDVVQTDGTITPPDADTEVNLVFTITRQSDQTTADTQPLLITVPAGTAVTPEMTAADIAGSITAANNPAKDSESFLLPGVPQGFTIAIKSVDPEGILGLDGTVTPPNEDTAVQVVFTVTRSSDSTAADTSAITITVPAKTKLEPVVPAIETKPAASALSYGQSLHDSVLTGGSASTEGTFSWKDETAVPNAGQTGQTVLFTPQDTTYYQSVEFLVPVDVAKADPAVTGENAVSVKYGQKLSDSTLSAEAVKNPITQEIVYGQWQWADPEARAENGKSYEAVFTPNDTTNYNVVKKALVLTTEAAKPVITVTFTPEQQSAGKEAGIRITVTNPYDAAFTTGLPVPEIAGITLTADGNTYTGTFTVPEKSVIGMNIAFGITTPEVAGMYTAASGHAVMTVAPEIIDIGSGKHTVDVTLPTSSSVTTDGTTTTAVIQVPVFSHNLSDGEVLGLDLVIDAANMASIIQNAATDNVQVQIVLPNSFTLDPKVVIDSLLAQNVLFNTAARANKSLTFTLTAEDGTPLYTWTFQQPASQTSGADINLALRLYKAAENQDIHSIAGDDRAVVIAFAHSGILPGRAGIRVPAGNLGLNTGESLYLYYYNAANKEFTLCGEGLTVDELGYVGLSIDHCSEYVLTTKKIENKKPDDGNQDNNNQNNNNQNNNNQNNNGGHDDNNGSGSNQTINGAQTGDDANPMIYIICMLLCLAAAGTAVFKKKHPTNR